VTCILSWVDHPRQATLGDVYLPLHMPVDHIYLGDIFLPHVHYIYP